MYSYYFNYYVSAINDWYFTNTFDVLISFIMYIYKIFVQILFYWDLDTFSI